MGGEEWIKKKIKNLVMVMVMNEIKEKDTEHEGFKILDNDKSARITFHNAGNDQNLFVPYEKSLILKSIGYQVFLITKDGKIDVTHKSGIPYPFYAHQLGGEHYQLFKRGKRKDLEPNELPFDCVKKI